jgi:hypothetical protein
MEGLRYASMELIGDKLQLTIHGPRALRTTIKIPLLGLRKELKPIERCSITLLRVRIPGHTPCTMVAPLLATREPICYRDLTLGKTTMSQSWAAKMFMSMYRRVEVMSSSNLFIDTPCPGSLNPEPRAIARQW